MAKESLFRTALQGFNKQDVLDYIEELSIKYKNEKEKAQNEIKSLKEELKEMPKLMEAKDSYDKLAQEKAALEKENADLNEAVKAQGALIDEKEQFLNEAFDEIGLLKEKIKRLESGVSRSSSSFSDNSFIGDGAAKELETILDEARAEAESVIRRANEIAEKIVDDAKVKAQAQADEAVRRSDEAVRDNLKRVKYLRNKKDELSDIIKNHKSQMDSFFNSISRSLDGDK